MYSDKLKEYLRNETFLILVKMRSSYIDLILSAIIITVIIQLYFYYLSNRDEVASEHVVVIFLAWGAYSKTLHSFIDIAAEDKRLRVHQHNNPIDKRFLFELTIRGIIFSLLSYTITSLTIISNVIWHSTGASYTYITLLIIISAFIVGGSVGIFISTLMIIIDYVKMAISITTIMLLILGISIIDTGSPDLTELFSVRLALILLFSSIIMSFFCYIISWKILSFAHRRLLF